MGKIIEQMRLREAQLKLTQLRRQHEALLLASRPVLFPLEDEQFTREEVEKEGSRWLKNHVGPIGNWPFGGDKGGRQ